MLEEQTTYTLPPAALATLADPSIKLVLHTIRISHYCARARWALRLSGLAFEEVGYAPLAHIPSIIWLQKSFKQGPGPKTVSSASPAATPVLALYDAGGKPLWWVQGPPCWSTHWLLQHQQSYTDVLVPCMTSAVSTSICRPIHRPCHPSLPTPNAASSRTLR